MGVLQRGPNSEDPVAPGLTTAPVQSQGAWGCFMPPVGQPDGAALVTALVFFLWGQILPRCCWVCPTAHNAEDGRVVRWR